MNGSTQISPIAVTMGEPAGIGGEIALKTWRALRMTGPAFFLIHDPRYLVDAATPVRIISDPGETSAVFRDALPALPLALPAPVRPGMIEPRNATAVIDAIRRAVAYVTAGAARAVVTNPIQKSALYDAGFPYPGHTEFLESLAGPPHRSVMMLASDDLRVVPVTIHDALTNALRELSSDKIVAAARATAVALRQDFGLGAPRLAIAGLNPHAGEDGALGREEISIIQPAIDVLRAEGLSIAGPLPPDTMFMTDARRGYDAAICMYHDQALIPIKTLSGRRAVNVTLGLPFVRTSPDHGTALDIAGKGIADPESLIAAIVMAAAIAERRAGARRAA